MLDQLKIQNFPCEKNGQTKLKRWGKTKNEKMQPQKISLYSNLWWFLNKERGRNDLFLQLAPHSGLEQSKIPHAKQQRPHDLT